MELLESEETPRVIGRDLGFPPNSGVRDVCLTVSLSFLSSFIFSLNPHGPFSVIVLRGLHSSWLWIGLWSILTLRMSPLADCPRSPRPDSVASKTSPSRAQSAQSAIISSGVCGRISQWLWSGWGGTGCEPAPAQPYQPDPLGCKACREWRVACDHTRPQCAHCYEQQILCFYVSPTAKPKRKTAVEAPILRPVRPPDARSRQNTT